MARLYGIVLVCTLLVSGTAAASGWSPPGWSPQPAGTTDIGSSNPAAVVLAWAVRGYQVTVSRVDGDRCPSHPTCSQYAVQALREHGPLLGTALTAGRLISEADEAAFAARIRVGDRWRIYAPVADDLAFLGHPLEP